MKYLVDWVLWPVRLCIAGGGGGGGADEQRRMEEERQRRIEKGVNRVNQIFGGPITERYQAQKAVQVPAGGGTNYGYGGYKPSSATLTFYQPVTKTRTIEAPGQFGDDYFSSIRQAYLDYYLPQVEQQYQDAVRAVKLGTPSLGSSSYARRSGQLTQDYERAKADISDRAESAVGEARSNIENSRAQILAAVRSGAGAEEAAARATEAVRSLKAPPVYSPLGDLFTRYLMTSANATMADNAGYQQTPLSLNTLFRPRNASYTVN
jgi:hypothetical protein